MTETHSESVVAGQGADLDFWPHNGKKQWCYTEKDGGCSWSVFAPLDTRGWEILLRHFKLTKFRAELPPEKITTMSPAELRAFGKAHAIPA